MKKSMTFLLGTLMIAGVLAGATTTTTNTTKKGTNPVLHGGFPAPPPSCSGCTLPGR